MPPKEKMKKQTTLANFFSIKGRPPKRLPVSAVPTFTITPAAVPVSARAAQDATYDTAMDLDFEESAADDMINAAPPSRNIPTNEASSTSGPQDITPMKRAPPPEWESESHTPPIPERHPNVDAPDSLVLPGLPAASSIEHIDLSGPEFNTTLPAPKQPKKVTRSSKVAKVKPSIAQEEPAEDFPQYQPRELDCDAELDARIGVLHVPLKHAKRWGAKPIPSKACDVLLQGWLSRIEGDVKTRKALDSFVNARFQVSTNVAPLQPSPSVEPVTDPLGFQSVCFDTAMLWDAMAMRVAQSDDRVNISNMVSWSKSIHARLAVFLHYPPNYGEFKESFNLETKTAKYIDSKMYGYDDVFVAHIVPLACARPSVHSDCPTFAEPYLTTYGEDAARVCLEQSATLLDSLDADIVVVCGDFVRQWLTKTKPTLKKLYLGAQGEDTCILAEMDGNRIKRLFLTTFHLEALFYVKDRVLRWCMDEVFNVAALLAGFPIVRPYLFSTSFRQNWINLDRPRHDDILRLVRVCGKLQATELLFKQECTRVRVQDPASIPAQLLQEITDVDPRNPNGHDWQIHDIPYISQLQQVLLALLLQQPKDAVSQELLMDTGLIPAPVEKTKKLRSRTTDSLSAYAEEIRAQLNISGNIPPQMDVDLHIKNGVSPPPFRQLVGFMFGNRKTSEFKAFRDGTQVDWIKKYQAPSKSGPHAEFKRKLFLNAAKSRDPSALTDAWLSFISIEKRHDLPPNLRPRWALVARVWETPEGSEVLRNWVTEQERLQHEKRVAKEAEDVSEEAADSMVEEEPMEEE
ncbi:hypothetical protein QM012_006227 [Aureobasidium pullulans]|uniref:XPG-I domain-containing protein n=1 Tax=Aureobasidium pullulans TaxID=5580 RepID=A0ABR0TS03_AURPU